MVLIVNGEQREIASRRIEALLAELDYGDTKLAIAINHAVVPRTRWAEVELRDGDAIEIISPRQGG